MGEANFYYFTCLNCLNQTNSRKTAKMASGGDDWDTVTYLRKKPQSASALKTDKAVNQARRAGGNKQSAAAKNTAVLDQETEELKHDHVSRNFALALQKARNDKGFTQKDFATKINEKPQVVNEYEQGKAIPNQQIIGKMERALGVKLRGKDMGKPLEFEKKK